MDRLLGKQTNGGSTTVRPSRRQPLLNVTNQNPSIRIRTILVLRPMTIKRARFTTKLISTRRETSTTMAKDVRQLYPELKQLKYVRTRHPPVQSTLRTTSLPRTVSPRQAMVYLGRQRVQHATGYLFRG